LPRTSSIIQLLLLLSLPEIGVAQFCPRSSQLLSARNTSVAEFSDLIRGHPDCAWLYLQRGRRRFLEATDNNAQIAATGDLSKAAGLYARHPTSSPTERLRHNEIIADQLDCFRKAIVKGRPRPGMPVPCLPGYAAVVPGVPRGDPEEDRSPTAAPKTERGSLRVSVPRRLQSGKPVVFQLHIPEGFHMVDVGAVRGRSLEVGFYDRGTPGQRLVTGNLSGRVKAGYNREATVTFRVEGWWRGQEDRIVVLRETIELDIVGSESPVPTRRAAPVRQPPRRPPPPPSRTGGGDDSAPDPSGVIYEDGSGLADASGSRYEGYSEPSGSDARRDFWKKVAETKKQWDRDRVPSEREPAGPGRTGSKAPKGLDFGLGCWCYQQGYHYTLVNGAFWPAGISFSKRCKDAGSAYGQALRTGGQYGKDVARFGHRARPNCEGNLPGAFVGE
jgi:hypothetical protein